MVECAKTVSDGGTMNRTMSPTASPKTLQLLGRKSGGLKVPALLLLAALVVATLAFSVRATRAGQTASQVGGPGAAADDAALLDGYRHVEVASVSDALE